MHPDYNHPKNTDHFLTERTCHLIQARYSVADSRIQRDLAYLVCPTASEFIDARTRYALELLAAYAVPALEDLCHPGDLTSFLQTLEEERSYLLEVLMPAIAADLLCAYPLESTADFEHRFELLIDSDFDGWESEGHRKVANQAESDRWGEYAVNADLDPHDHPIGEHPNKTFIKQKKREYKLTKGEPLTNNAISAEAGYESESCTELKRWMNGDPRSGIADAKIRAALERVMSDTPLVTEAEKARRKQQISKKTKIY